MLFGSLEVTTEVVDLGEVDPALSGIYSPRYSDATVARYVHGQFLKDADSYLERYQATDYWMFLLRDAQRHVALGPPGRPLRILDLGSGGGNTVLPLLDLYPDAEVVASDLSLPLLKALRTTLSARYPDRRVSVLQQNAENLLFADRQFDLVVGGAVLHHLRSPRRALAECARVLRPGGFALFFEPFLSGNRIVAAVFRAMLDLNADKAHSPSRALPAEVRAFLAGLPLPGPDARRLPPELTRALGGFCRDFALRSRMNRLTVRLRRLDDKWLFEKGFFASAARASGFREPLVYALRDGPNRFAEHLRAVIRLVQEAAGGELPRWASELVDGIDPCLAPDTRRDAVIEAGIVLERE